MKLKGWKIPFSTSDIDQMTLARRVRFESNDVIRLRTIDNRDILYKLEPDGTNVTYLSEVKLDNERLGFHKISSREYTDVH